MLNTNGRTNILKIKTKKFSIKRVIKSHIADSDINPIIGSKDLSCGNRLRCLFEIKKNLIMVDELKK
jgi:hypothetical protein